MEKTCLYCGTPFSTNRESKKYCKDNCKQLAYLQRCGMVRSGNGVQRGFHYQPSNTDMRTPAVKDCKIAGPVNDVNPINDVKDINSVKNNSDVNYTNENGIPFQLLDKLFNQITQAMEAKFDKALENIRQEFKISINDKTLNEKAAASLCSVETFTGVFSSNLDAMTTLKKCQPCSTGFVKYTGNEKSISPNREKQKENGLGYGFKEPKLINQPELEAEIIPINKNSHPKQQENEEENYEENYDDEEEDEEITELPEKLHCLELADDEPTEPSSMTITGIANNNFKAIPAENELTENAPYAIKELEEKLKIARANLEKHTTAQVKPLLQDVIKPEPAYEWIESKLMKRIERLYTDSDMELKFRHPHSHWGIEDAQIISWVNIRLRCLLENLIRLSNFSYIDRETFSVLTNAFVSLVKSETFQRLPSNYHYARVITELAIKLNNIKKLNNADEIRIQLPLEKKAILVVIRKQILNNTASVKFSQLHFEELRFVYTLPTKPASEKVSDEKVEEEKPIVKEWEKRAAEAIRLKNVKKAS